MDYGKSFTYIFDDESWIGKFLIGVVVGIIPIVNFATYGYLVRVVQNVRDGVEEPLPEWDDFGGLFISGLKLVLGTLVYALPAIFVSLFAIPFAVLGGENPGGFIEFALMCITSLSTLLSLVVALMWPALMVQYAKREQVSDLFAFSEIWEMISSDLAAYFIIMIFVFFATSFIGALGFLVCFIGVFFTYWYAYLVSGHLIGQYAAHQPGIEKTV